MPKIIFELDLSDELAQIAKEKGLLSSQSLAELIKREIDSSEPLTKHELPVTWESWMEGVVAPELLGKGKILVSDEEFIAPIDDAWEANQKEN
jgi:hypothetical protein